MIDYDTILTYNAELIQRVAVTNCYPNLQKELSLYNNTLLNTITYLIDYLQQYTSITSNKLENNWGYASLDTLVSRYKGSKSTWSKNLIKLEVLGLIQVRNPRPNQKLTKQQQISVNRMQKNNRDWSVRYYRLPFYTESLLSKADELAISLNQTAVNKDSIRDKLGTQQADRITDTRFGIHEETQNRRDIIKYAITNLLQKGYTTQSEIMSKCEQTASYNKYRWVQTYKAYKQLLFAELHLKESKPTKQETAKYNLMTNKYIIREATPESVIKPLRSPVDIWWDLVEDFVENGVWEQYEGCNIQYEQPEHTHKQYTNYNNSSLMQRCIAITSKYTYENRTILKPIEERY